MKRRRLGSLLAGSLLGLLATEAALQVGAFVIWRRRAASASLGGVLCVGDSFTYGLGATGDGGSYPRQLEALLQRERPGTTVVNGGWPGQSSRDVLLRLPEQLARHRPAYVCVLVGINDPWKRPQRVTDGDFAAAAASGFPVRVRLAQVFVMMADWLREKRLGDRPFVGTWHSGDFEVTFESSGRVVLGKDEMRWLEDETGVVLVMPNGTHPLRWELVEGRLSLRTPSMAHVLDPGPAPAPSALSRGSKALARGDTGAAQALLLEALAVPADAPRAREGLLRLAVAAGDTTARALWLDELRAEFARAPAPSSGAALSHALAAAGEVSEALDVAEAVLSLPGDPSVGDHLRAWEVLLTHGLAAGARARVFAVMERVLAGAAASVSWRPTLLQMRAALRRSDDAVGALADLFAAFLQDGDAPFLVRQIEIGAADFTADVRERALGALPATEAARVRAALASDLGAEGVLAVLRFHLQRIAAVCQEHGAEVVFLSYPEPDSARDALTAGVATALGVRFVPLHPRFTALLANTSRDVLFIADGHCTDRGYGEMAAGVAEALR